ncbi:MAG: hypothetical protein FJX23_02665 [Alphaproteobacteria bacterium]|nr:hypothetical protein [Alphaproteobacteria bacterium]
MSMSITASSGSFARVNLRNPAEEQKAGAENAALNNAAIRVADAQLKQEAQRLKAEAQAAGGNASLTFTYATAPDGTIYVSSVKISRTVPDEQANALAEQGRQSGIVQQEAELSASEQARVAELQAADIAVRNHEMLHYRTAGGIASGTPDYSYVQGPDGQYYAVAGAVHVHTTATSDPEKSARDAATMARAALAPGDASAADLSAARSAMFEAAGAYGKVMASNRAPQSSGIADITA